MNEYSTTAHVTARVELWHMQHVLYSCQQGPSQRTKLAKLESFGEPRTYFSPSKEQ